MKKAFSCNGFTLVELAIVLMIIGLLIGGILKGQEMIQNARVTSTIRQLKSYDAAYISFLDAYGAKPGDITNPSTRLPNCTAAKCNAAGNGNGMIGPDSDVPTDENFTFWVHLAVANLISGVDPSSTWASIWNASMPTTPLGGSVYPAYYNLPLDLANYYEGVHGTYWYIMSVISGAGQYEHTIPLSMLGRLDRKIDDGKPWVGDMIIGSGACAVAGAATVYPTTADRCSTLVKFGLYD